MAGRPSTSILGLLLSVIALFSYPFFFVRWPLTRDFPWLNLLLFVIAAVLVAVGLRRSFLPDSTRLKKIAAVVASLLSAAALALFVFAFFVFARQLPASHGAPQVGSKAPEFQLPDTNGKPVALSELLTSPINGHAPKGVLLVFYRGYW
jgi:hypothetical protein